MEMKKVHVLVFPLPVQGHINPMLQFSKRLASKGLTVTFITTKSIVHEYPSTSISVRSIQFPEADSTTGIEDFVAVFRSLFTPRLADFIHNLNSSATPSKYFLIYDSVLPWALEVARASGVDGAPFFTQSWAVNAVYFHVNRGHLKVPSEAPPIRLPAMPELDVRDLPSFAASPGSYPSFFDLVVNQFSNFREAKWIFCNTFHELEDEILEWMATQGIRITGVGPTVPSMYLEKSLKEDKAYGLSLFKPDHSDCIKWLDSKEANSVVYASFGSLASLGEEQMLGIAWGLKRSNMNFLWVVREGEQSKLPADITEASSEKGLLVSWCPQLEVLAHQSVGCFMTHAGWNSTMEALCLGVPMVTMPQWTDQPMNAKYIEDVWGVGVRIRLNDEGIVTEEEVERCIREVMEGEKSMVLRSNSERWKKFAKEAMRGGTSDQNINQFLDDLTSSTKDSIQRL